MTELVIISGKGGTGKTSLVASIGALAENKVMVDCDVDAADLHLILNSNLLESHEFIGGKKAEIIEERCNSCAICLDYCRFDAISENEDKFKIDPLACEGCGICKHYCPEDAIAFEPVVCGHWYMSETIHGPLVHARLGIAQSNSGRLVSHLRKQARELAAENGHEMIIVDGPPGIGCPVIASITGSDYVAIVTEPSLSAFGDMKRVHELIQHFNVSCGVIINKYDINPHMSAGIEAFAEENGIAVLGRIPFDKDMVAAQVAGKTIIDYQPGGLSDSIREIWKNLQADLKKVEVKKIDLKAL
ncbi:MAG TPA: (4Fe-4S)-binding protein [candidate division Zixibacteria bacterium]|nr:(4Fe-4S)-binding protein [candidate division Zixibacteria bacterium]HEQ97902.1 (4Fe-4S)-binding protein [candidate division Zixibacteria bacterium]